MLLSIVIPTKDRYEVLIKCLETFEQLDRQHNFEVVVFDSSTVPEKIDFNRFKIRNLRYIYEAISGFCATFSSAMKYIESEYVTFIGDDDAILPSLVDVAIWARNNNVDSVTPLVKASYIWPGIKRQMGKSRDADRLLIQRFTGNLTKIDAQRALLAVVSGVFQEFNQMPKIYHGLVKVDSMREVKLRYGDYFIGSSPDISASIALADIVIRHYVIDLPLTLPGSSPSSGAGASLSGKHIGTLKNSPLAPFINVWPQFLPEIYTVQTMWAFSGLYVLWQSNFREMVKAFDQEKILAAVMVFNLSQALEIMKAERRRRGVDMPRLMLYLAYYSLKRGKQLTNRITHRGAYDLLVDENGLGDILEAQRFAISSLARNSQMLLCLERLK